MVDFSLSIAFYLVEIGLLVAELFEKEISKLLLGHPVGAYFWQVRLQTV